MPASELAQMERARCLLAPRLDVLATDIRILEAAVREYREIERRLGPVYIIPVQPRIRAKRRQQETHGLWVVQNFGGKSFQPAKLGDKFGVARLRRRRVVFAKLRRPRAGGEQRDGQSQSVAPE